MYDVCNDCGKIIRYNKLLFGSLHSCISDEDIEFLNNNKQFKDVHLDRINRTKELFNKSK